MVSYYYYYYKYHEKVERYRIEMDMKNLQKPKAGVG